MIWKRWKREMTARLPVTVSSVQTWFYMYAYVKKSLPGSTQLPTSRHLLSPPTCATMTHIHTRINRLWSPLAYGLGGNNYLYLYLYQRVNFGNRWLCQYNKIFDVSPIGFIRNVTCHIPDEAKMVNFHNFAIFMNFTKISRVLKLIAFADVVNDCYFPTFGRV